MCPGRIRPRPTSSYLCVSSHSSEEAREWERRQENSSSVERNLEAFRFNFREDRLRLQRIKGLVRFRMIGEDTIQEILGHIEATRFNSRLTRSKRARSRHGLHINR